MIIIWTHTNSQIITNIFINLYIFKCNIIHFIIHIETNLSQKIADTKSISTEWGLVLLSRQPEIQEKVRNELITVLDDNNIDYKKDSLNIVYDLKLLLKLPLFRALIHEILRISCVARLGVLRKNTKDMSVTLKNGRKYNIPKNSQIFFNVEAIHYDLLQNEDWKNKEYGLNYQQICLQNWLKPDTGKFYQNPSFITFGHGKRVKFKNILFLPLQSGSFFDYKWNVLFSECNYIFFRIVLVNN